MNSDETKQKSTSYKLKHFVPPGLPVGTITVGIAPSDHLGLGYG